MGGGGTIFGFYGGHSSCEGDIELTGGVPPTRENPGKVWLANVKVYITIPTLYIYCFQRISQNIKANKLTWSCEFPCRPFVWLQNPPNVSNKQFFTTKVSMEDEMSFSLKINNWS